MADNVAITAGAGTLIGADDVSGVYLQKIKLDVGTDGATSAVAETANLTGKVPVAMHDKTATGTVDMASTANASAAFTLEGLGQVFFTVDGTWTGNLVIEYQDNADVWQTGPNIYPLDPLINTYGIFVVQATVGATSSWKVVASAGLKAVRLRCYTVGTGTASVHWRAGYAPYDFTTTATAGDIGHDGADSGAPVKVGHKAVAFGASPTAVAAADRTDWYANRHGIPFALTGHMNTFCLHRKDTAAQTDAVLQAVAAGQKAIITAVAVMADHANSVDVGVSVEFDDTADVAVSGHPGIAPGSGYVEGNGGGILAVGADGQDVLWTCEVPTGGNIEVFVRGFLIES